MLTPAICSHLQENCIRVITTKVEQGPFRQIIIAYKNESCSVKYDQLLDVYDC